MGYIPKFCQPVNGRYSVPLPLLDLIGGGSSCWSVPLTVLIYHFLRLNGFESRRLPDSVLAEAADCSVQTVARVRPSLERVFFWERSPGGAHAYSLRPVPGLHDRGVAFVPSRAFHESCRIDRTGGAAAGYVALSSWSDASGRVHPSADWDGVASRAQMTSGRLRGVIGTLTAAGILTETDDPSFPDVCPRSPSAGSGPYAIRLRYPRLFLPRDHPRLPPPPDWADVAEASSFRSDPRRCGRKGGIIRWRGHSRPSGYRVSSSPTGAPYIYTEALKPESSRRPPSVLKPFLKDNPPNIGRGPPDHVRLRVSAGERRMLETQQGIQGAARWGLTDRKRLELFRRAQNFVPVCGCRLPADTRRVVAERALIFGEETLIRHQAALTGPGCRRQAIINRDGWTWSVIRNETRILVRDYHYCPPVDEPSAPPTPEAVAAHENNMRRMKTDNPELFNLLTRMSKRRAKTDGTGPPQT